MTACPVCGKEVDPLRAPAVGVRDGKVIPYCSKEHAVMAESGPTKLVPTKIVRLPSNAEPFPTATVPTPAPAARDSAPQLADPPKPTRPKRAQTPVQIADTGTLDDYVTPERRRGLVIAIVVFVLAGGVAVAYFTGLFGRRHEAASVSTTPSPEPTPVIVPLDAAPAMITADEATTRATTLLRGHLTSESARVQQVAAAALSRTGDAAAIQTLVALLAAEPSDVKKTEIAYALARAGDARGLDALLSLASPQKRETKHEAGRRLAMLGDARATKILESSLAYPQFKLGVAEALAFVREPRALVILKTTLADTKALPDDRERAAIALGWAGEPDASVPLRALIKDDRGKGLAAHALGNLHDEAARPELEAQLDVPSLRVRAARALRLLAPTADTAALIQRLASKLASEKDTDQIDAAEALLILAGPPAWSTRE